MANYNVQLTFFASDTKCNAPSEGFTLTGSFIDVGVDITDIYTVAKKS